MREEVDETMSPTACFYEHNILECQLLTFCLGYKQYFINHNYYSHYDTILFIQLMQLKGVVWINVMNIISYKKAKVFAAVHYFTDYTIFL